MGLGGAALETVLDALSRMYAKSGMWQASPPDYFNHATIGATRSPAPRPSGHGTRDREQVPIGIKLISSGIVRIDIDDECERAILVVVVIPQHH
jgi:hypothetical protein